MNDVMFDYFIVFMASLTVLAVPLAAIFFRTKQTQRVISDIEDYRSITFWKYPRLLSEDYLVEEAKIREKLGLGRIIGETHFIWFPSEGMVNTCK